jgi:hypothetical protein
MLLVHLLQDLHSIPVHPTSLLGHVVHKIIS